MVDLLWLSAETPAIDGGGGQRRQFHQVAALVESGVDVVVATLAGPQNDSSLRAVAPVHRFETRRFRSRRRDVERIIERCSPSHAVVAHVESAPHVIDPLARAGVPFLVDFQNVVSRWHDALGEDAAAASWRRREREVLATASAATACSREERAALVALGTNTPIEVSPHGVDPAEWPDEAISGSRDPVIAMFGSWTHSPNRVAAEWFVANVWPRVRSEVPESRFQLLGPGDAPEAATLQDGVDATGRVTSLAHVLGSVRVAVVPIQIGIGTRVKFIESLASGAAVVSTAAGSEGFSADGCFIQVDEPESFARACIELLRDVDKASDLGRRGRRLAFNEFSWDEVIAPIRSFSETAKA